MTIQDDVIRLSKSGVKRVVLSEINQRDDIAEARGAATYTPADNSQLQSPLTEISRTVQTVTVDIVDTSLNPVGSADIEVITSVTMRDARGYDYVLNFAPPA